MNVSTVLRELAFVRARGRCEYCLIHQDDSLRVHEVDHVRSVKHGGRSVSGNVAVACMRCNRRKSSDLGSVNEHGVFFRFFDPRQDRWDDHFVISGAKIEARTPKGEVTVRILQFNTEERIEERLALQQLGRYPTGAARVS